MRKSLLSFIVLPVLAACVLAACSPTYNWRDYNSPDAPYQAMFPDKPVSHKRSVNLDGLNVDMTMTAAQIDGTVFAIGSAEAPDAAKAQAAVAAMRSAMVKNIGGTVTREEKKDSSINIDAKGTQNGMPTRLVGHFEAHGNRVYQVIVMGKENAVPQQEVDMFLSSFKPN